MKSIDFALVWFSMLFFSLITLLLYRFTSLYVPRWKQYKKNVHKRFTYWLGLLAYLQVLPVCWFGLSIIIVKKFEASITQRSAEVPSVVWVCLISVIIAIIGHCYCEKQIKQAEKQMKQSEE